MQIGIAGAGAIAMGYAAFLAQNGHSATLWSPSGNRTAALLDSAPIKVTGAIEGTYAPIICASAEELAAFDVIILALPANGHRSVLDSLLPYIERRHAIIISGHLSFAGLYLAKRLAERAINIPIIAWNTTVLTCKVRSATEIRVGVIRAKVDMAAIPVGHTWRGRTICAGLFGHRFTVKDDLLTIALSNLNPQNHLGIALCNLTRIEHGEAWRQTSNITPTVGRLLEALDRERLAIAASFGKPVRTIFDHYALSHGIDSASVVDAARQLVARGSDPAGPVDTETRYVTEDVPFGLVPTLFLARLAGVAAPLHKSGVDLLSAAYSRDFRSENDLLAELGPMNAQTLLKHVTDGYAPADRMGGYE
jgi:opine dehydrogenase